MMRSPRWTLRPMPWLLLAGLLSLLPCVTHSQDLVSGPGNDVITDMVALPDGGYAVCGYTSSNVSDLAGLFARIDSSGDVLAATVHMFEDWVKFTSITRLTGNVFAIAGSCGDPRENDLDACMVIVDGNGSVQWQEVFGGNRNDEVTGIVPDNTGGCIMAGVTEANNRFLKPFLARFDSEEILYFLTYGGDTGDYVDTIVRRPDDTVVAIGSSTSFDDDTRDVYALCADMDGNVIWETIYPHPLPQDAFGAVALADGRVTVAGRTAVQDDGNPENTDVFLLQFDSDGTELWTSTIGYEGIDHAAGIAEHPEGGFVVAGRVHHPLDGESDAWLLRTDANGDTLWTQAFGDGGWDEFHAIGVRADTVYVAVGENDLGEGHKLDFYIVDQELGENRLLEPDPSPTDYRFRAYPNPFNPSVTAEVVLERPGRLTVDVVNILGRKVAVLVDERRGAGVHRLAFTPGKHASGMYLIRVALDGASLQQQKVMLLR